jgi:TrmH family RNA methyltransferase
VLVLDGVQDPGNVGTLLRTALSFGFMDVVLGQGSADLYNNKTLMASQGSLFKLNVLSNINLVEALPIYKKDGYFILSTDLKTETTLSNFAKPQKLVLILGNEGQGVSPAVQSLADERIRLEMSNIDSLNVAIAGGILMYELAFRK